MKKLNLTKVVNSLTGVVEAAGITMERERGQVTFIISLFSQEINWRLSDKLYWQGATRCCRTCPTPGTTWRRWCAWWGSTSRGWPVSPASEISRLSSGTSRGWSQWWSVWREARPLWATTGASLTNTSLQVECFNIGNSQYSHRSSTGSPIYKITCLLMCDNVWHYRLQVTGCKYEFFVYLIDHILRWTEQWLVLRYN